MKTDRKARSSHKTPLVASLALACTLAAGSAGAGIPVTDVGNMPNHIITQISSYTSQFQAYAEYGETLQRWQRTAQEYSDALTKLSNIRNAMGLSMDVSLTPRDADYNVEERCPSPDGGGLPFIGTLWDLVGLDNSTDVLKQQQVKCIQIVSLENKKYNELVEMLKKADERKKEIEDALEDARSDDKEGTQEASDKTLQGLIGASLAEMQYSEARIGAFDGMIAALTKDQSVLAQKAMKGSQSSLQGLVGTIAQGITLEATLNALRTDCRRLEGSSRYRGGTTEEACD
jgi:hypothetical protein